MNAIRRKTMVKFCLAMGLFILAGVFRQLDHDIPPLAAAACFMLTNLIYIGVAMAWGFSISNRILHKNVRQYLLLGCAMAVMWMFLRTVKYRFFDRQPCDPLFVASVLCASDPRAAFQPVCGAGGRTAGGRRDFFKVVSAAHPGHAADRRCSDQRSASDCVSGHPGRRDAGGRLYPRLAVLHRHGMDDRPAFDPGRRGLSQMPSL